MNYTKDKKFKLSIISFIAIIFLTVYGIASPIQFYYQMGYSSILYLIIGAVVFLIPYSFIVSEMSLVFKNKKGGIFSWMSESVGENYALIGTIMWYGSIVTMWFSAATISILISTAFLGIDTTSNWHILFLSSSEVVALIGVAYMVITAFISTKGLKKMTFLSNISLVVLILIHVVLFGGALLILALDHFRFAQGFDFKSIHSYFVGPNPAFKTPVAIISFMIYIIFGYGGMENAAGLVDRLKNPKKTIKIGIIGSAFIIVVLYILIIIALGIFANWKKTFDVANVNLANLQVVITQAEFYKLGILLHLSQANSVLLGHIINQIINVLTLIGLTSVPIRIYTPIKHMFEGIPSNLLPKKIIVLNKHGIPKNAVIFQTAVVSIFILLLGFGGGTVSSLFNKITLMISISAGLPIIFIIVAYLKLKITMKSSSGEMLLSKKVGIGFGVISAFSILFVSIVSIIEPLMQGQVSNTLWIIAGPIFFIFIAILLVIRKKIKS